MSRELEAARERLVAFVDDRQTSDEENQQITEDALSANEELQSLTEELETAKEELQSTNEELLTMNRELESRNAALLSSLELTKSVVQTVPLPVIVVDGDLRVVQMNGAFMRAFGVADHFEEGGSFLELCGGAFDVADLRTRIDGLLTGRRAFEAIEIRREIPSAGMRVLTVGGVRLEQLESILLNIEDVTVRREAEQILRENEEQRLQNEKMEHVGRLAGGIAHEFNNLLTVIIGNAELVGDTLGRNHPATGEVAEIRESAAKAAALTDQLLSVGRRKILQPTIFDVNPLIADLEKMLRRLLGERIRIDVRTSPEVCLVEADQAEIGRAVMNLCLNARDAMPAGGVLTLETGHVSVDESGAASLGLSPGRYVRLVVSDTGPGMDSESRRLAFEPFLPAKEPSKGADLGLAAVFGVLQLSGGSISCDSELGHGTRFTALLPAATGGERVTGPAGGGLESVPKGTSEVVLLVEDDDGVRGLTRRVLERSGYVVLHAKDGREGLSLFETGSERIDILVTDVLMPELSGGPWPRAPGRCGRR